MRRIGTFVLLVAGLTLPGPLGSADAADGVVGAKQQARKPAPARAHVVAGPVLFRFTSFAGAGAYQRTFRYAAILRLDRDPRAHPPKRPGYTDLGYTRGIFKISDTPLETVGSFGRHRTHCLMALVDNGFTNAFLRRLGRTPIGGRLAFQTRLIATRADGSTYYQRNVVRHPVLHAAPATLNDSTTRALLAHVGCPKG